MLTCGLALATTVTAGTAAAGPRAAATPAELGISFNYDGHDKQCVSPGQQWAPSPDWTNALLVDTDSRRGGCLLAFGVRDLASNLTGLALTYGWAVSPGGHSGQCGNTGVFPLPITPTHTFGSAIRADTDDRGGYCNLTFAMSGRTDVALDIRFWAEVEDGKPQCVNSLPQDEWHSVRPGAPITIGLNTDSRIGGCHLSLRLRQF
ncbi:hypothetical protein Q5530_29765 [Saccharothrix sp. BKS2]|uniref:hypothetical protein n=1 Tax=Saccharothrix sp. BKS2 TaxID=3064400 RepID=UPI0039EB1373